MREEIRCACINRRFAISIAFLTVCLLAFSVPSRIADNMSGLGAIAYYPSALQYAISPLYFGGFQLLIPFCAASVYAGSQVEEFVTGSILLKGIRGSVAKYANAKAVAVVLGGGLSVSLGFILHALVWNLIALPCDPALYEAHVLPFEGQIYDALYRVLHGLPMYAYLFLGIGITGAVWALVGLSISVWIPDQLITMTIPAAIYYLWSYGITTVLFGFDLPSPSALFNDGLTFSRLAASLVTYAVLAVIAYAVYAIGIRRRLKYA